MRKLRQFLIGFVILLVAVGSQAAAPNRPFDEFGDINCEDEMARLDNFAVQLQNEPQSKAVIIFFAGTMRGGKLPKRGEAEARVARIRSYLTETRGVPGERMVIMNAGYDAEFNVRLWSVPPGAELAKPEPHQPVKQINFRKGKVNPRDYRCEI